MKAKGKTFLNRITSTCFAQNRQETAKRWESASWDLAAYSWGYPKRCLRREYILDRRGLPVAQRHASRQFGSFTLDAERRTPTIHEKVGLCSVADHTKLWCAEMPPLLNDLGGLLPATAKILIAVALKLEQTRRLLVILNGRRSINKDSNPARMSLTAPYPSISARRRIRY